jgi:hypothetical protein
MHGMPPKLLERLTEEDRMEYYLLEERFGMPNWRASRHGARGKFRDLLNVIRKFVMKGDEADGLRGMATGIFWINDGLAVNPLVLSRFTSKSKSSINGGFQALGYRPVPVNDDIPTAFIGMENASALSIDYCLAPRSRRSGIAPARTRSTSALE